MTRRLRSTTLLAALLATLGAGGAVALDVPLAGKKIVAKGVGGAGKLVLSTRGSVPTWPAPDISIHPTRQDAQLLIINPASRESVLLQLPAQGWSASGDGLVLKYRNRGAPGGPSAVKVVNFKQSKGLKLVVRSTGITLDEPTQGTLGAVLRFGQGILQYCAVFGGTVKKDLPGKFVAKNASPPGACPEELLCGNGALDAGEECEASAQCGAGETCASCQCVGVGDVSVQLLWGNENDLDLHVIDPDGEEIFFGNTVSLSGGQLDQDANAGCTSSVTPIENIFWSTGTAPSGLYAVLVTNYGTCAGNPAETPFTVRTIVDGVMSEYQGSVSIATQCGLCTSCGQCTTVTTFTR